MKMNFKLQTLNSILNTQYPILFFILIICLLSTVNGQLSYAAEDLEVAGNIEIESPAADNRSGFVFMPQAVEPAPATEGQMYYNDPLNVLRYYDGSAWQSIGGGTGGQDKTIATKIVAASNSLDKTKADYVCDGVDDQQEINQAIGSLPVSGGTVYLLEGSYNISDALLDGKTIKGILYKDNIAIIGTGAGTRLIKANGSDDFSIFNPNTWSRKKNNLFANFLIDMNSKKGNNNYGIYALTENSKIDNVWIENAVYPGSGGQMGIGLAGPNNIISNCYIRNIGFIAINCTASANSIISNNIISNNETGIVNGSYDMTIANNIICDNRGKAIVMGMSLPDNGHSIISGNIIYNNGRQTAVAETAIVLSRRSNCLIIGNNISSSGAFGIEISTSSTYGASSNNIVMNNLISNNVSAGIEIFASSSVYAVNNSIMGNCFYENGRDGITLSQYAVNSLISSNIFYKSAATDYGLNFRSNSNSNNYLVGNFINGFSKLINDLGTNTKYTQKEKITIERQVVNVVTDGMLEVSFNPRSYVVLQTSSSITLNKTKPISDGKNIGDMLILEGPGGTNTVTIDNNFDPLRNVLLGATERKLGENDILKLVWNGTDWAEITWANK